jgi:DNA polymerase (family X)
VDIRVVDLSEFGSALLYFTGSREHTIHLRTLAKEKGLKINEYGLYDTKTNKRLAGETEEGIYKALGLDYLAPELRE